MVDDDNGGLDACVPDLGENVEHCRRVFDAVLIATGHCLCQRVDDNDAQLLLALVLPPNVSGFDLLHQIGSGVLVQQVHAFFERVERERLGVSVELAFWIVKLLPRHKPLADRRLALKGEVEDRAALSHSQVVVEIQPCGDVHGEGLAHQRLPSFRIGGNQGDFVGVVDRVHDEILSQNVQLFVSEVAAPASEGEVGAVGFGQHHRQLGSLHPDCREHGRSHLLDRVCRCLAQPVCLGGDVKLGVAAADDAAQFSAFVGHDRRPAVVAGVLGAGGDGSVHQP